MTGDGWLRAGTGMSIGVSPVILTRFVVAMSRAFGTGMIRGYRRENAARDAPPPDPDPDTDALLDRVDVAVRALRTSTTLLTATTDSLAAALAAAAAQPPATAQPPVADSVGPGAPAAGPPPAPEQHRP